MVALLRSLPEAIVVSRRSSPAGFTLIELALVLLITSLLLVGGLSFYGDRLNVQRNIETEARLDRVEAALRLYVQSFGALPCPAVGNVGITESPPGGISNFGVMTCDTSKYVTGAVSGYGAGDMRADLGGRYMLVGAVPVRTLGLPDSAAFDGWNNRIMYAVDLYYAYNGGTPQWNTGTNPGLIVKGMNGTERTNCSTNCPGKAGAVYVLWSYGQNMWGAWRDKATTSSPRRLINIEGSVKGDNGGTGLEVPNAHVNVAGDNTTSFTATFTDAPRRLTTSESNYSDDLVRWKTRFQF